MNKNNLGLKFEMISNYGLILQAIFNNISIEKFNVDIILSEIYIKDVNNKWISCWEEFRENEFLKLINENYPHNILELLYKFNDFEDNVIWLYIYDSNYGIIICNNTTIFNKISININNKTIFKDISFLGNEVNKYIEFFYNEFINT